MVVVPSDTGDTGPLSCLYIFSLKHTVEIRVAFDKCQRTMGWENMEMLPASRKAQCVIFSEDPH